MTENEYGILQKWFIFDRVRLHTNRYYAIIIEQSMSGIRRIMDGD